MVSRVLGSVQPAYLAWIPFFQRMAESDVFVYLDDVKYSKNSFHNRNQIKTPQGPVHLTVPVRYTGHSDATIQDIGIDNTSDWTKKHWRTIAQSYSKAPFFPDLAPALEAVYGQTWTTLGPLNIALAELFREFLGIRTPCQASSALQVEGEANVKLVNLCRALGADGFIVKPGTEDYHPRAHFEPHGVGFRYFTPEPRIYPQLHGEFLKGLSILDYAMNCGPNSFGVH